MIFIFLILSFYLTAMQVEDGFLENINALKLQAKRRENKEQQTRIYFEHILQQNDVMLDDYMPCSGSKIGASQIEKIHKLHAAAQYDSMHDLLKIMLARKAKADITDNNKTSALHICAECNQKTDNARLILEVAKRRGCNIKEFINQARYKAGKEETALDIAIQHNRLHFVQLFLHFGALRYDFNNLFNLKAPEFRESHCYKNTLQILILLYAYDLIHLKTFAQIDEKLIKLEAFHPKNSAIGPNKLLFTAFKKLLRVSTFIRKRDQQKKTYMYALPLELICELENYYFGRAMQPKLIQSDKEKCLIC